MSTEIASELSSFHRFITERLDQGEAELTPEQALDIWRASHSSPEEYDQTVAALREALDAMKAGDRGVPWEDFSREFRAKRGIPPG